MVGCEVVVKKFLACSEHSDGGGYSSANVERPDYPAEEAKKIEV